ncbi:MAG: hypothetical protein SCALA702_18000 [Melioribacteraceae bacterium]|nr:MAG: hypothetical protein SCALA702_18000 [Melioribacteraceae bacterium]
MKRLTNTIFILVLSLFITTSLIAQLSPPDVESVYGGRINSITGYALTVDTSRIFISTESANSIFYADVYANTATPVFNAFQVMPGADALAGYGLSIRSMDVHETSGYLYFAHEGGVYGTTPSSSSNITVTSGGYYHAVEIIDDYIMFSDGPHLYFGTLDAAGNFTAGSGSPIVIPWSGGPGLDIVVHPKTDSVYVFVASSSPALYKLSDPYNSLSGSTTVSSISLTSISGLANWSAFGIAPNRRLFLAGENGMNKTIAYSDDEVTWTSYTTSIGGVGGPNLDFSGDSLNFYMYFASCYNNNNGLPGAWQGFGVPGGDETHPNDGSVYTDPVNPAICYMTTDQGIGASTDNGATIFEINEGVEAVWTRDFDMTPTKYTGWLASKSGIRRVNDYVNSPLWTNAIFPNGDGSPYYSAEMNQTDTTTVYVGNVRVYKTTDNGSNWNQAFTPENPPYNFSNVGTKALAIEVYDNDPNIVFAGFEIQDTDKGGLFYSTDAGANWDQILMEASSVGQDIDVSDIVFNIEGSDTVAYVSAIYDLSAPQGRSVYRLVKSGSTWTPSQDMDASGTSVGYAITATIWDLQVSTTGDTIFAAGTDAGTNHPISYYKPLNTTGLWTPFTLSGFPIAPGKEATATTIGIDTVYCAVDNEVYYLDLGTAGATWVNGYTYPIGTRINFLYYDELLVGTDFGMFGHLGTGSPSANGPLYTIELMSNDGAAGSYDLELGIDPMATDGIDDELGELELPPLPPAGVYDARLILADGTTGSPADYRNGDANYTGQITYTLKYQLGDGATGFTLDVNIPEIPGSVTMTVQDPFGGVLVNETLNEGIGQVVVTNTSLTELKLIVDYNAPIPVELSSFSANVTGEAVTINWVTATETNNRGFEIERSNDNTKFNTIGYIDGFGTTSERQVYSYTDYDLNAGTYYYRLKQVDFDGSVNYSETVEADFMPVEFSLGQNYPNPFNPTTNIKFALPVASSVKLVVYNMLGQQVQTLVNEKLTAGLHEVNLNASRFSSGVYIYAIEAQGENGQNFSQTRKMMLIK